MVGGGSGRETIIGMITLCLKETREYNAMIREDQAKRTKKKGQQRVAIKTTTREKLELESQFNSKTGLDY